MVARVLRPEGKGFILLDSHPGGCARIVEEMIAEVPGKRAAAEVGPRALVIGCSAGYGLSAAIAGLFGHGAQVIGLCYERPATARRSASAGWYKVAALVEQAAKAGLVFEPMNGDCFDPAVRRQVLDRAADKFGQVDVLIYSVAAPRRTDPKTGDVYHSAVKPIGGPYQARNLTFSDAGEPSLRAATLEPASEAEVESTVKVMGGEDWADWVTDMASRKMLAPGFATAALTYVGSDLTAPIYRQGTIGRAKDHLEATAGELTDGPLAGSSATAVTSVNGAAVTLSSLAIPGISIYLTLLHEVAGDKAQSAIDQSLRLWAHLTGEAPAELDDKGRLRLDGWELAPDVQAELRQRWGNGAEDVLGRLADPGWFRQQILRLYGFEVDGIDYSVPVEVDESWPIHG